MSDFELEEYLIRSELKAAVAEEFQATQLEAEDQWGWSCWWLEAPDFRHVDANCCSIDYLASLALAPEVRRKLVRLELIFPSLRFAPWPPGPCRAFSILIRVQLLQLPKVFSRLCPTPFHPSFLWNEIGTYHMDHGNSPNIILTDCYYQYFVDLVSLMMYQLAFRNLDEFVTTLVVISSLLFGHDHKI